MSDTPPPQYATPTYSTPNTMAKNPAGVGKALWISLFIHAGAQALGALAHSHRTVVIDSYINREISAYSSELTFADDFVRSASLLIAVSGLASFIFLVIWLHRITKHSRAHGATFPRSDGWAIGGFFVPVMNLYVPYGFARDNSRFYVSNGLMQKRDQNLVTIWWISYILLSIYNQSITLASDASIAEIKTFDTNQGGAYLFLAVSVAVGAMTVRLISKASKNLDI